MKTLRVLLYEDDQGWKDSFEFNLGHRLTEQGVTLVVRHCVDDSLVMQDLEWLPDLIMIDYDLGGLTGLDVLNSIQGDPQFTSLSMFLYSGGESLEALRRFAGAYPFPIACYTKEGEELDDAVMAKGRSFQPGS